MKPLKIAQVDSRGQIVIPKHLRQKMNIDKGTGFFIYSISNEDILLRKIPDAPENLPKKIKRSTK